MEINLTPEMEAIVQERIQSGEYRDATEVMQDALRSLERESACESPELEAMIQEGLQGKARPLNDETLTRILKMAEEMDESEKRNAAKR